MDGNILNDVKEWCKCEYNTCNTVCYSNVMLGEISRAEHIYITCGYIDMRKSIDGLASIVQNDLKLSPFLNLLFMFCGHKEELLKDVPHEKCLCTLAEEECYCHKKDRIT